ncbi:MAG: helix-turn-helix domain-containing protein [Bacillota bacterium]|jgi:hypothetical protein
MKGTILLPRMLLEDRLIPPLAKLLYVIIEIHHPTSITNLAELSGVSRSAVSRLCEVLNKHGWIVKAKEDSRIVPYPAIPHPIQEQMIKDLYAGYSASPHKGEYLTKAWLSHLILTDDYIDNARPAFLQNPITGELMELDRFIPSLNAGIEHHGPQHFSPTNTFPDTTQFKERRARDLIKRSLCEENNIRLIVITAEELSLAGILKKLPKDFPLRRVDVDGPYVKTLENLSAEYRAGLTRAMARETRDREHRNRTRQFKA